MKTRKPATIIVTHNRRHLLVKCIGAVLRQTLPCDIIIVDNASTDNIRLLLEKLHIIPHERIHYIRLAANTGGSGGFNAGLRYGMTKQWDWFWMLDDDAEPLPDALEALLDQAASNGYLYGSTAVEHHCPHQLCFPIDVIRNREIRVFENYADLDSVAEVGWLPFLGFLIHRELVERIGYPDETFFILSDDIEYSERAKQKGAKIFMVKNSVILHPAQNCRNFTIGTKTIYHYRNRASWRAYFDARNKITVGRRYYPRLVFRQTLPGIFFRAACNLIFEENRAYALLATLCGVLDGISGRPPRRRFIPRQPK
jgi:rhamnopyranosyl-N-acetylglucosaminyl-diphospho-decaprenol beta-1,3/1,4-galactofuranosyltransferase